MLKPTALTQDNTISHVKFLNKIKTYFRDQVMSKINAFQIDSEAKANGDEKRLMELKRAIEIIQSLENTIDAKVALKQLIETLVTIKPQFKHGFFIGIVDSITSEIIPAIQILLIDNDIQQAVADSKADISVSLAKHFAIFGDNTIAFEISKYGMEISFRDEKIAQTFSAGFNSLGLLASMPQTNLHNKRFTIIVAHRALADLLCLSYIKFADSQRVLEALYVSNKLIREDCLRKEIFKDPMRLELAEYFLEKQLKRLEAQLSTLNEFQLPVLRKQLAAYWQASRDQYAYSVQAMQKNILVKIDQALAIFKQAKSDADYLQPGSGLRNYLTSLELVTLVYFGNDQDSISLTLAAHFSQLCKEEELFIRLEEDGLRFYSVKSDQRRLQTLLQSYGINAKSIEAKEGPATSFQAHRYGVVIPDNQLECLLELSQYHPSNIKLVIEDLYKAKNRDRVIALLKSAIKDPQSQVALSSDIPKLALDRTIHPDGKHVILRTTITAPAKKESKSSEIKDATLPAHVIIIFDDSGSMGGDSIVAARMATMQVIRNFPPETLVTVLALNQGWVLTREPRSSIDERRLQETVGAIPSTGSTPLIEATVASVNSMREKGRMLVKPELLDGTTWLLMTDGQLQGQTAQDLIAALQTSEIRKTKVAYANETVNGLGTVEYPNRTPVVLVPIGIGSQYDQNLISTLGRLAGYGYYHVPNVEEMEEAVVAAGTACGFRTKPVTVGLVSHANSAATVGKELPRILQGQSTSHCFVLPLKEAENFSQLTCYGDQQFVVPAQLAKVPENFVVFVEYIRQRHAELMTQYDHALAESGENHSARGRGGRGRGVSQLYVPAQAIEPNKQPEHKEILRKGLYELIDFLGDNHDPLVDAVRHELVNSLDSLHGSNSNAMRDALANASRFMSKAAHFQSKSGAGGPSEEKGGAYKELVRDKDNRVRVRASIKHIIKTKLGFDAFLTIDSLSKQFVLDFSNKVQAQQFATSHNPSYSCLPITHNLDEKSVSLHRVSFPSHIELLKFCDALLPNYADTKQEMTPAGQIDLLQRFVGIAIEELVGCAQQSDEKAKGKWPSGLRFEYGRPRMLDCFGKPLNSIDEIDAALRACNPSRPLSADLRALLQVIIERHEQQVRQEYSQKLHTYSCLTMPRYSAAHSGLVFKLTRRDPQMAEVSRLERELYVARLRQMLATDVKLNKVFTVQATLSNLIINLRVDQQLHQKDVEEAFLSLTQLLNNQWLNDPQNKLAEALVMLGKQAREQVVMSQLPPGLIDLLQDPIDYSRIDSEAVITPSGYTYNRKPLEKWCEQKAKDPLNNAQLDMKNVKPNIAIQQFVEEIKKGKISNQELPQALRSQDGNAFGDPVVDDKGITHERTELSGSPEAKELTKNLLLKNLIDFYQPTLQMTPKSIEHPDILKVLAAASAMLLPGAEALREEEALNGSGLPQIEAKGDSVVFSFSSIDYAWRLRRALAAKQLVVEGTENAVMIKDAVNCKRFFIEFCGIAEDRLKQNKLLTELITIRPQPKLEAKANQADNVSPSILLGNSLLASTQTRATIKSLSSQKGPEKIERLIIKMQTAIKSAHSIYQNSNPLGLTSGLLTAKRSGKDKALDLFVAMQEVKASDDLGDLIKIYNILQRHSLLFCYKDGFMHTSFGTHLLNEFIAQNVFTEFPNLTKWLAKESRNHDNLRSTAMNEFLHSVSLFIQEQKDLLQAQQGAQPQHAKQAKV